MRSRETLVAATIIIAALAVGAVPFGPARAAVPPSLVNYQGVLRDQNDKPLTGTYDVTFRFMSDVSAGDEILIDQHAAETANAVTVSGGLFGVALGSGTVTDGSGPGTYTSLDSVFRDYGSVWLEVTVGAETLSPRTPIRSAPFALNASQLGGQPAGNFIDTSSTQQAKNGRFNAFAANPYDYALVGQAQLTGGTGVYGYGAYAGVQGLTDGSGYAAGLFVGTGGSRGIIARASDGAGRFEATSTSAPTADLALGSIGVTGTSLGPGGTGIRGNGGAVGVEGIGNAVNGSGGRFTSTATPGLSVSLADASNNEGVNASGGITAGSFTSSFAGSTGLLGTGVSYGVRGSGNLYGGHFAGGNDSAAVGVYGYSTLGTGVKGNGGAGNGAQFDTNGGAHATLATSDGFGINASGPGSYGGYLSNGSPWFSYAYVPFQGDGVYAWGQSIGGEFRNFSSGSYALVGYSTYKIIGSGSVSFVQNHPEDPSKVIVYAAPEGDEVAVYTRGSGRLTDGEARVALGETFALVANPDIGLTATVTPVGDPVPLSVASKSTHELVVRGPAGSTAEFDYIVWGLRIGFEEQSIVQPKRDDSRIPSMHEHETYFAKEPALRGYTALARFRGMEGQVHGTTQLDLSRSQQLRDAIGVVEYNELAPAEWQRGSSGSTAVPSTGEGPPSWRAAATPRETAPPGSGSARGTPVATIADARTARLAPELMLETTEPVDAGDLLVLDPLEPGKLRKSASPSDLNVAAIAQDASVERDGVLEVAVATSTYALVKVDAQYGAIRPGDLLVSSETPGRAMVARAPVPGTVIGKALQPLDSGTGLIRVLLLAR
jgi:hypothetical protein